MNKLVLVPALVALFATGMAVAAPTSAYACAVTGQPGPCPTYDNSRDRHDSRRPGHDDFRRPDRDDARHHHPFETTVTETWTEVVANWSWVWDWKCFSWTYVQTGTRLETRTETRVVRVFWHSEWRSYVYYNRSHVLVRYNVRF